MKTKTKPIRRYDNLFPTDRISLEFGSRMTVNKYLSKQKTNDRHLTTHNSLITVTKRYKTKRHIILWGRMSWDPSIVWYSIDHPYVVQCHIFRCPGFFVEPLAYFHEFLVVRERRVGEKKIIASSNRFCHKLTTPM